MIGKGVPQEELPGALFAFRPPTLWKAIAGLNNVVIYLGMYVHSGTKRPAVPAPMSIARYDAEAATNIISHLNSRADMGDSVPGVRTRYIRFEYTEQKSALNQVSLEEDKNRAQRTFTEMRSRRRQENAILLGSQRVNYVVECMVADLFGCDPFEPVKKEPKVPFYIRYRPYDQPVPSCFGGPENPGWLKGDTPCGTHYVDQAGKWQLIEWKPQEQDAGIVIIVRDDKSVNMAAFGFSGRATKAIGTKLIKDSDVFWSDNGLDEEPLEGTESGSAGEEKPSKGRKTKKGKKKKEDSNRVVTKKGEEVGVYVCRVTLGQTSDESDEWEERDQTEDEVEIIPLGESVLEPYLNRAAEKK